jgi:hypothetical protein
MALSGSPFRFTRHSAVQPTEARKRGDVHLRTTPLTELWNSNRDSVDMAERVTPGGVRKLVEQAPAELHSSGAARIGVTLTGITITTITGERISEFVSRAARIIPGGPFISR